MRTLRSDTILGNSGFFKNAGKCFLFHLKSSFCSPDLKSFVLTFQPCRKTAWLERKIYFKIHGVTTWETDIAINILSNQPQACNFIKKETLAQVLSCEFCDISKNTFFTEHILTTTPEKRLFNQKIWIKNNISTLISVDLNTWSSCISIKVTITGFYGPWAT